MNGHSHALNILFVVALAFSTTTSCAKSSHEEFQPAYWPTQEWKNSPPEQQGMDSAQLVQMFEYIEENSIPLHSLSIVRIGYLVTEAYWHPYGPNDKHSIESITKSIIGAMVGIAIEQGKIQDVDQILLDFFPHNPTQNLDGKKRSITLSDLLSMTPGWDDAPIWQSWSMEQRVLMMQLYPMRVFTFTPAPAMTQMPFPSFAHGEITAWQLITFTGSKPRDTA